VELTVLGASGTWPGPGQANCGYLVSHEGHHLWMDAGSGTFANLQRHIRVDEISAVLISHGHADHFVDTVSAFYARHYGGLGTPGLPFYSPPDFVEEACLLVSEGGLDVMRQAFAFTDVVAGSTFDIGPFHITVFPMEHIGVLAVGYRIEADGVVLAYTGDTGPSPEVLELAKDADLLLCEATYQESSHKFPFHMSAVQAGEHATASGAKRLLLTHILPVLDPEVSAAEAARSFAGPVHIAREGAVVEITR
jgi:ribonuclease BN (tRNA processing enzyme)